jgi:hypothetical protein
MVKIFIGNGMTYLGSGSEKWEGIIPRVTEKE